MIYEQLLPVKHTPKGKLKRALQIIGVFHYLIAIMLAVCLAFIHWKLLFVGLVPFVIGLVWGNIACLFAFDYKYIYNDGVLTVYRTNTYGKYKLKLIVAVSDMIKVDESKAILLTEYKERYYFSINGVNYAISPDNFMLSLIEHGVNNE